MDTLAKNRALWIALGIVIVAVVAYVLVQGGSKIAPGGAENAESAEDVSAGSANAGVGGTLSYQQALTKYVDHRIQFDPNCQAVPNNITYKDNTGIMLDNRSGVARTIKIGSTYTVKAWGFKIITLPDTYRESKTFLVDCDRSQNVATVLVQE